MAVTRANVTVVVREDMWRGEGDAERHTSGADTHGAGDGVESSRMHALFLERLCG